MARSLLLFVLLCCSTTLITCSTAGFRMQLTHVDAKGSYTAGERVQRAVTSSRQRLASIKAAGGTNVSAPVHWATSQYIAEYLIGSPPQRAEALIDTGSDLIWTQCSTCQLNGSCVKQDLPFYNLSNSATFRPDPCNDTMCLANDVHHCATDGSCTFEASYGAGDAYGSLGTELFDFQTGTANLSFGCVKTLMISPGSLDGASGLIGLGRGPLSLVSQMGATRFSYCLTPYFNNTEAPSHLFVGDSASLTGAGPAMSMPFVKAPNRFPLNIFYYVPLVGISIGDTNLSIPTTVFTLLPNGEGGVIVDSGSPITALVDGAYGPLKEELGSRLNGSLVPPPAGSGMDLCVPLDVVGKAVPPMVFHFSGGADMVLPPANYWGPLDNSTSCLMMTSTSDVSIIGNFQFQNIHLLYDLAKNELSFQTADCTTL